VVPSFSDKNREVYGALIDSSAEFAEAISDLNLAPGMISLTTEKARSKKGLINNLSFSNPVAID